MPPATTPQRARTSRRSLAATVVLAWLAVLLVATSPPAGAVAEIELAEPTAGSVIEAPFSITVRVRPDDGEVIEQVEARLAERVVRLVAEPGADAEGRQVWRASVDPSEGLPLPNGAYGISVRVTPLVGEPAGSDGHEVQLKVPPPRRDLSAQPRTDDATAVDLAWEPVALPDFVGYRVQRRPDADSGTWATVHDLTDPRATAVTDRVEQPGRYRYRLIVVRSDGSEDGELFATSAPRGVQADPEDPGTFPAPPEPDPRPTPSPDPTPAPTEVEEPPAPQPPPPPPPPPAAVPRPPGGPVTVAPPAPPPIAPPAVVPFDDGVFEELLPFEVTESEMAIVESETAFLDGRTREGGTLAVLTDPPPDRGFLKATAAGLLLIVISAHVRRFLSSGRSR